MTVTWRFRVLIGAIAVSVIAVSAAIGLPAGYSAAYNLSWLTAFERMFWAGHLYPRHLPDLWQGLGGLDFFFYGPMSFWITALTARPLCPACDPGSVIGVAGGILLVLSGAAFYLFARHFVGRRAAIGGAAVYMVMPYHLFVDWFYRQALAEFAAYLFIPIMALGLCRLAEGRQWFIVGALSWAGLVMTHLPTALLAAHLFLVIGLWRSLFRGSTEYWVRFVGVAVCGLLLAAVYWLPAIELVREVSQITFLQPVFQPAGWLIGDGRDAPVPREMTLMSVLLLGALACCALALSIGFWRRRDLLIWIAAPALVAAFLMSAPSTPVWENWIIQRAQFPWRMLVFADLAVALAFAAVLSVLARPAARLALVGMSAILAGTGWFALQFALAPPLQGTGFAKAPLVIGGALEFLPVPITEAAFARVRASGGGWRDRFGQVLAIGREARAKDDSAQLSYRRMDVDVTKSAIVADLPLPYWRRWRAMDAATGAGIRLEPIPASGLTRAHLPRGTRSIRIVLPWANAEYAGLGLTVFGALWLLLVAAIAVTAHWWGRRPTPI